MRAAAQGMGRRLRRDPLTARAGSGAEDAGLDRRRDLQRVMDGAPYALPDLAGGRGAGRAAGRRPACRQALRRCAAARHRPSGSRAGWERRVLSESNRFPAAEAVARLKAGVLTAEQLTRDCLDRIAERASVKAWTHLDPDHALAQARAADRAGRPGLLAGLPIGVKDVIDTYDMPTQHGSPIYRGNRPFADAACVAQVRMAGGTILGKTVTTEFANRFPGATVHPHNAAHTPGGSSSGSAAAVADFQVPLALGTQTGGSVIRPAAFCGVIGYKPSFGEFSRVGIKLQCQNLDTFGLICRGLDDIALLRAVLIDMPHRKVDRGTHAPRVGVCRTPLWDAADAPTQALIEDTAASDCPPPARGSATSPSPRRSADIAAAPSARVLLRGGA